MQHVRISWIEQMQACQAGTADAAQAAGPAYTSPECVCSQQPPRVFCLSSLRCHDMPASLPTARRERQAAEERALAATAAMAAEQARSAEALQAVSCIVCSPKFIYLHDYFHFSARCLQTFGPCCHHGTERTGFKLCC